MHADHPYRSHHCNAIRREDVGQTVTLSGWVHRKRDHGELLFIDLRDHYGITQLVAESDAAFFNAAGHVPNESVVRIEGQVVARSEDTVNPGLPTGEVEVKLTRFEVESEAAPLPLQVNAEREQPEETRLTYRFLDLRRESLHRNIILRSQVIASLRRRMTELDFLEIQTPILTASSPEGARDYLVPSRLHPGQFYALPQAPQQFKQLLMTAGFDRYFQIAPCFRDEDARADRSPGEFYQLDMEMAFATQEDVFAAIEPVMTGLFEEFSDWTATKAPFPRIPYAEAMLKYGSDKPDLRNPIEIADVTEVFDGSDFSIFAKNVAVGKVVRAIPAPGIAGNPRSYFDKMIAFAQENGAKGLGYIIFAEDGAAKGPIAKFLDEGRLTALREKTGVQNGDVLFFSSDEEPEAARLAGIVRDHLGRDLDLLEKNIYTFCWIVDFPFYEYDEEQKKIDFSHNPFSMPQGGLEALETQDPLTIKAWQYDIVCNGVELSSGAIRNHRPDIMLKAFEIAGYDRSVVEEKFGALYRAFQYGAPPHGGIAPGVDRIVMLLANAANIREVIAFPMNQKAQDLLMNAPAEVDEKALRDVHLTLSMSARKALAEKAEKAEDGAQGGGEASDEEAA